jgi:hypothetical protein
MLYIRENEAQVVERIVERLTTAQCTCFVFQAPPSSLLQLEQMAVVDLNIVHADQKRTVQSMAVTVGVVESHHKPWNPRSACIQSSQVSRPGKPVVCFYCWKPGHIQKKCFLCLAQLRKSERLVFTVQP